MPVENIGEQGEGDQGQVVVDDINNNEFLDQEQENPKELTPEEKAAKSGWKNYDDYVAGGGDPENHTSPEVFLALKGPLKKIRDQTKRFSSYEREVESRIQNLNNLHKQQLDMQKSELTAKRDQAIQDLDAAGAAQYQKDIDTINDVPAQQQASDPNQGLSQELVDWNADPKNSWFKTESPKSVYAANQFSKYKASGVSDSDAIRLMESDIRSNFAEVNNNARGQQAPMTEGNVAPSTSRATARVTMQTLTPAEAKIWNHSSHMWGGDEKAFLKSVLDSRKG